MDEDDGAIEREDRQGEEKKLRGGEVRGTHGHDQSRPSDNGVEKEIGPIDRGVGLKKILDDLLGVGHGQTGGLVVGHIVHFCKAGLELGECSGF